MSAHPYPTEFVDRFLKQAAALMKPFGVGDVKKAKSKVPSGHQVYAQPASPVLSTQPALVSNQKAVTPPPIT